MSVKSFKLNGNDEPAEVKNIPAPNPNDKTDMIISWVEKNIAPPKTLAVNREGRIILKPRGQGYLLCSYPAYPEYIGGPVDSLSSYISATH